MGVVHLARKPGGERVALKVLRPHIVGDDEARARLAREVSSLSRIRSKWVAEIVDADPWGPVPFVATRYVPGYSLHDQVQEEGPVRGTDLIWLARSLAEGIATVHAAGVLHRDVKPSNVLMEGRTPILIDFGLARVADDPKLTHTGWLLGTPGYLPPEILHGDDATHCVRRPLVGGDRRVRRPRAGRRTARGPRWRSWTASGVATTTSPGCPRPCARWSRPRSTPTRRGGRPSTGSGSCSTPTTDAVTARIALLVRQPPDEPEDLFTMPLAIAAQAGVVPRSEPDDLVTEVRPTLVDPGPPVHPVPAPRPGASEPRAAGLLGRRLARPSAPACAGLGGAARAAARAAGRTSATELSCWWAPGSPWPRASRRSPTSSSAPCCCWSGCCAAGRCSRVPPVTASGSGARRSGTTSWSRRSPPPWHLVRSIPTTFLLYVWASGFAVAAGLLCYAFSVSLELTLFISGLALVGALYLGPGGSRVRRPLARLVVPLEPVDPDLGTRARGRARSPRSCSGWCPRPVCTGRRPPGSLAAEARIPRHRATSPARVARWARAAVPHHHHLARR